MSWRLLLWCLYAATWITFLLRCLLDAPPEGEPFDTDRISGDW